MKVKYISFVVYSQLVTAYYCSTSIICIYYYADTADGVNTPSPVINFDVNKIPPTPTKTIAAPSFQNLTNGKLNYYLIGISLSEPKNFHYNYDDAILF